MTPNFGIKNSSYRTDICKISYNFLTMATIWAVMLTKRIWAPKKLVRLSKWVVNYLKWQMACMLFSTDLRLSTDGLYTVECPSNGRRASSISALPAPAAQTSAGGTACSLLPAAGSAAAQASPPHCTPIAGLAIPLLTHSPTPTVILRRWQTNQ